MIELPISWIITVIVTLAGVIGTLAGIMWSLMVGRLKAQDRIISRLQADIERVSTGCGVDSCVWRNRTTSVITRPDV